MGSQPVIALEHELLARLGAVVFQTDASGNWTYINPAWTRITGFSAEETLGTNFLEYVHPEEREHTIALFMAVLEGAADSCHHETRYRTKSGEYRWLELRATLLYDDGGNLIGNCGTLTDITARRKTESRIEERLQLAELVASGESFEDLPYGALLLDKELVVQRASATAQRLLGHPLPVGTKFAELLPAFDVHDAAGAALTPEWSPLSVAGVTGQTQYAELQWRPFGADTSLWLQTTVIPSPDSTDSPGELVVLLQDVTELRKAEIRQATVARLGQHALEAPTLHELLEGALVSLIDVLDADFADLFVAFADSQLEMRAHAGWEHAVDGPDSELCARLLHLAELAQLIGRPVHTQEVRLPDPRSPGHASTLSVPIQAAPPQVVVQIHSIRERTFHTEEMEFVQVMGGVLASAISRRELEDAAVALSLQDPLTGLANRTLLRDRLEQALLMRRESDQGLAVMVLDLDGFKRINDSYGHDVGDEVLRCVATRLSRATRDADTVARVGGDEFVILLPDLIGGHDVSRLAARLLANIAEPIAVGQYRVGVQASVGVAVATEPVVKSAELLKRADVAMYQAKRGRTGYAVLTATGVPPAG